MNKIRTNAFFCEDVRFDNEGKPMFIGVLAPVGLVNEVPYIIDAIQYVNLFYVSTSIEEFTASLAIGSEGGVTGFESDERSYARTFKKPTDLEDDEDEWVAISHLRLKDLTFLNRAKLTASLRVDNQEELRSVFEIRLVDAGGETEAAEPSENADVGAGS